MMNMHFFRTPHFYTSDPACVQADLCVHDTHTQDRRHQKQRPPGRRASWRVLFPSAADMRGLLGGERHMHARTSHVSPTLIRPTEGIIVHPKAVHRGSTTRLSDLEAPSKNTARHAPGVPARHQRRRNGVFLAELGAKIRGKMNSYVN